MHALLSKITFLRESSCRHYSQYHNALENHIETSMYRRYLQFSVFLSLDSSAAAFIDGYCSYPQVNALSTTKNGLIKTKLIAIEIV